MTAPVSDRDRARLRRQLPAGIEGLRKRLDVAERALAGVDPEEAFVYLASMADHLGALIKTHQRAALAALGDPGAPAWATRTLGLDAKIIGNHLMATAKAKTRRQRTA